MGDDASASIAGQFKKFTAPVQPVIAPSGDTDVTSGTIKLAIYFSVE
jgi:hypothetical protein